MVQRPPFVKPTHRANRGVRDVAVQQIRRQLAGAALLIDELNRRLDYVEEVVATITHEDKDVSHDDHATD